MSYRQDKLRNPLREARYVLDSMIEGETPHVSSQDVEDLRAAWHTLDDEDKVGLMDYLHHEIVDQYEVIDESNYDTRSQQLCILRRLLQLYRHLEFFSHC